MVTYPVDFFKGCHRNFSHNTFTPSNSPRPQSHEWNCTAQPSAAAWPHDAAIQSPAQWVGWRVPKCFPLRQGSVVFRFIAKGMRKQSKKNHSINSPVPRLIAITIKKGQLNGTCAILWPAITNMSQAPSLAATKAKGIVQRFSRRCSKSAKFIKWHNRQKMEFQCLSPNQTTQNGIGNSLRRWKGTPFQKEIPKTRCFPERRAFGSSHLSLSTPPGKSAKNMDASSWGPMWESGNTTEDPNKLLDSGATKLRSKTKGINFQCCWWN